MNGAVRATGELPRVPNDADEGSPREKAIDDAIDDDKS